VLVVDLPDVVVDVDVHVVLVESVLGALTPETAQADALPRTTAVMTDTVSRSAPRVPSVTRSSAAISGRTTLLATKDVDGFANGAHV
jgi:hypothetical protein